MFDYVEVAEEAAGWARDMTLSDGQRRIAEQLADLAGILSMEGYGCPSEHAAAGLMYRYLRSVVESKRDSSLPLFPPARERRKSPRYVGIAANG